MFDLFCRSTLVSIHSKIGVLERSFSPKGIQFYRKGHSFDFHDGLSTAQTNLYLALLHQHGIELEEVFEWFFEKYIPQEFEINGFSMSASTPISTFAEKCRNLASEMDGILKQFRMFVRDGEVDRELYEMSSEHVDFGQIPSLIAEKYVYPNSELII